MKNYAETTLFEMGAYSLKLHNLVSVVVFIGLAMAVLVVTRRLIYKSSSLDLAKKFAISKLVKYLIVTIAFIASLQLLGFNVSVLLAGSAALLVGLGFGLQNLFTDFISGIILLVDGTLKVGDIIEVNSMIYKVLEINFRTTTVQGRDENYIILPNSQLTGSSVTNWTHSEVSSRFKVTLGVDYATDIPLLTSILTSVAKANKQVLAKPEPFVRFEDFADSALMFSVFFYTDEVFRVESIKSDIRTEVFKALKSNGINIPFPQRVVYLKNTSDAQ